MTENKNIILQKHTDYVIHEDRLCDEVLLQLMIKEPVLQNIKVSELRRLARDYSKRIRNLIFNLKDRPEEIITDNLANDEDWISGVLENRYISIRGKK